MALDSASGIAAGGWNGRTGRGDTENALWGQWRAGLRAVGPKKLGAPAQ